ncbi:hypothetical protein AURDEDRAFT_172483 [Auricularia subglabra TFB-10046 SS5]|nr:hypothetical protein AURDEDRAFT_172483 [Auricularia subglabra TFB-10046 SS5]
MLAELKKDDIVFGIFPIMSTQAMGNPWFETVRQLLDALEQVLEGLDFMHRRLIAHTDFDFIEVYSNYGRGYNAMRKHPQCHCRPAILRSCCPDIHYLINDFELSVVFAPDSDPKSRVVTGTPNARYGVEGKSFLQGWEVWEARQPPGSLYDILYYGKCLPPEARLDAPYCPFKADIYQFGQSALNLYNNVQTPPELRALFVQMASDDPDARPTAPDALSTVRNIRQNASEDVLDDVPPHNFLPFRRFAPGEQCTPYPLSIRTRSSPPDDVPELLAVSPDSPRSDIADVGSPRPPLAHIRREADNDDGLPGVRAVMAGRSFRLKWTGHGLVKLAENWPDVLEGLNRMAREMERSQPHYHPESPAPNGRFVHDFAHDLELVLDLYEQFTATRFLCRESLHERKAVQFALAYTRGLISNGYFLDEGQGCLSRDVHGPLDQPITGLRARDVIEPLENAKHALEVTIKMVRDASSCYTRYE